MKINYEEMVLARAHYFYCLEVEEISYNDFLRLQDTDMKKFIEFRNKGKAASLGMFGGGLNFSG